MIGVDSCVFLIFTTRVDQTNGSTLVKLILFEKSRVELEFVFSIFTTRVRKHFGNSGRLGPLGCTCFTDWTPRATSAMYAGIVQEISLSEWHINLPLCKLQGRAFLPQQCVITRFVCIQEFGL